MSEKIAKNMSFVEWAQEMSRKNTVIDYLIYRKPGLYTPHEQDKKYMDETIYEDSHYNHGIIREVIDLGNGDYMLGMQNTYDSDYLEELPNSESMHYIVEYVRLSEIRMMMHVNSQFLDNPHYPRNDDSEEEI